MNFIYLFLSIILSFSAFATELKCSKNGTAIVYINGFGNTKDDLRESYLAVWGIAGDLASSIDRDSSTPPKSNLYYDFQYNHTTGLITDLLEAFGQKWRAAVGNKTDPYKVWSKYLRLYKFPSTITDPDIILQLKFDLDRVVENLSQLPPVAQDTIALAQKVGGYLVAGKKTVLVSHSQGNLFSNEMYRVLQQRPEAASKLQFYSNLMVATPANSNYSGGPWITLSEDAVIKPFGLNANYELIQTPFGMNHGFYEIYLSSVLQATFKPVSSSFPFIQSGTMEQIFTGNLIETAKLLESNCDDVALGCRSIGPAQEGKYYTNPDGTKGGFVANTAFISPTNSVFIGEKAQVCDQANLISFTSAQLVVTGSAIIFGNARVTSEFSCKMIIDNFAKIAGNVIATSTCNTFSIIGSTIIYPDAFVGNINLSGSGSLGSSNPSDRSITVRDSNIIGVSNIYDGATVYNSTIINSDIYDGASVDSSYVESSKVFNNSFITSGSTITGSNISNYSFIERSSILNSNISESAIIESSISSESCVQATYFKNDGIGCGAK